MKKSARNGIIIAGISVAAAAMFTVAFSKLLVNVAVKRKQVKLPESLQNRISGGTKENPNVAKIMEAAERSKSVETVPTEIKSRDGLVLKGHEYPCDNPKRIIIAMHGWRSCWNVDFGYSMDFLHDNGSYMIYPDQRGQNDSEGEYIGFGVLERFDCVSWAQYASEKFGGIPVYLYGVSMGATTVVMASGLELPDCVKGIISDCGFTSPHGIWKHVIDNNLHLKDSLTYPIINRMCKRTANFDGEECSTTDALAVNKIPVLFIHGTDDKFVPVKMTFDNYLACRAKKKLLVVPGADHGMSYVTDKEAYEKEVNEFFCECEAQD